MKGVKTMSVANASAKVIQSDDIIAQRVRLPGLEVSETLKKLIEDNKKHIESVKTLTDKVKELEDKYNALETE